MQGAKLFESRLEQSSVRGVMSSWNETQHLSRHLKRTSFQRTRLAIWLHTSTIHNYLNRSHDERDGKRPQEDKYSKEGGEEYRRDEENSRESGSLSECGEWLHSFLDMYGPRDDLNAHNLKMIQDLLTKMHTLERGSERPASGRNLPTNSASDGKKMRKYDQQLNLKLLDHIPEAANQCLLDFHLQSFANDFRIPTVIETNALKVRARKPYMKRILYPHLICWESLINKAGVELSEPDMAEQCPIHQNLSNKQDLDLARKALLLSKNPTRLILQSFFFHAAQNSAWTEIVSVIRGLTTAHLQPTAMTNDHTNPNFVVRDVDVLLSPHLIHAELTARVCDLSGLIKNERYAYGAMKDSDLQRGLLTRPLRRYIGHLREKFETEDRYDLPFLNLVSPDDFAELRRADDHLSAIQKIAVEAVELYGSDDRGLSSILLGTHIHGIEFLTFCESLQESKYTEISAVPLMSFLLSHTYAQIWTKIIGRRLSQSSWAMIGLLLVTRTFPKDLSLESVKNFTRFTADTLNGDMNPILGQYDATGLDVAFFAIKLLSLLINSHQLERTRETKSQENEIADRNHRRILSATLKGLDRRKARLTTLCRASSRLYNVEHDLNLWIEELSASMCGWFQATGRISLAGIYNNTTEFVSDVRKCLQLLFH